MIRCAACGCENRDGAKFCRDCGAPLEVPSAEPSEQITAPQPEQLEATCEDVEPAEVPTVSKEDVEESPALKETVCEEAHDESVSVGEEVETQEGAPQVAVEVESPMQVEAPFTALPEGALLAERRYEVVAIVTESQECNIYEAIGTEDSRKCPQCGYLAPLDENFCAECGASLSEAEQCVGRYYILEVPRGADVWLSKLDGLYQRIADILPRWYEKFEACPYDASERSYVVLEQIDGELLSEVDVSTWSLKRVLETARTLCRLLAGLMDVGFYVPRLVEHAIVIPPERVIFIGFHAMREYEGEVDTDVLEMVREFTAWLRNAVQPFATETAPSSEAGTAQKLFDELSEREGAIPGIAELSASLDKAMKELEAASVLSFRKAALTDVGRVRELNEDSFMTLEWEAVYESHPVRIGVYLVADGMGGHEAGEIASRLALECVGSRITRCLNEFLSDARSTELASLDGMALLREAFEHANATVFQQAQAMRNNMGTTLVGVLVIGARAWFANVGDSRAYLLHGGKLEQVTVDHSLVQQLVDSGHITREEARWHPQRNVIYRAIGLQADVDVDIFERVLMPGDCVLLCSDGLSDLIEDDEIERVILSETDLHAACMRLIGLANDRGGNDNITVVLVAVEAGMSD